MPKLVSGTGISRQAKQAVEERKKRQQQAEAQRKKQAAEAAKELGLEQESTVNTDVSDTKQPKKQTKYNDPLGILSEDTDQAAQQTGKQQTSVEVPETKKQETKYNDPLGILSEEFDRASKQALNAPPEKKMKLPETDTLFSPTIEKVINRGMPTTEKGRRKAANMSLKAIGEQMTHIPEETVGLIARPFTSTAGILNSVISKGAYALDADQAGDYFSKQAEYADQLTEKLKTPITDERFDLASSLALGAIGGGVGYLGAAKNLPTVLRGMRAARASMATGGITAATEDFAINRVMENTINPMIDKSGLNQEGKMLARIGADLMLGFGSGATVARKMGELLQDPSMTRTINEVTAKGAPKGETAAQKIMEKFKGKKPIPELDPRKEVRPPRQPRQASTQAVEESTLSPETGKLATRVRQARHGASMTAGAAYYGVEQDEDGNIYVDPRKALMGAGAGLAGSTIGGRAAQQVSRPLKAMGEKYTEKIGEPLWNRTVQFVNKRLTNENARRVLGLERDPAMRDVIRETQRAIEQGWESAAELGRQMSSIAPTRTEQRRLMQVIRGGVTANPEMQRKAEQVRNLFAQNRQEMQKLDLLDYSRYDKLTRRELADIRKRADAVGDPEDITTPQAARGRAEQAGVELPKKTQKNLRSKDPVKQGIGIEETKKTLLDYQKFQRQRLRDWYHHGSVEEYTPIKYTKYEGMSRAERKELKKEIDHLKKKSRSATPEGKQELEEIIVPLEKLAKKQTPPYARRRLALNIGHTMRRQDLPEDVQQMMGRIDEAPYPVASELGKQWETNTRAKVFDYIAEQPDWAFTPQRGQDIPGNYVRVNNPAMGALNGKAVRKDVYDDLRQVADIRTDFGRLIDSVMGKWRYGKVVLNPSTHARNFMSNALLAYWADVHPGDLETYSEAIEQMHNGGQLWQEAKDWGLFRNTFARSELENFRDEVGELRDGNDLKDAFRRMLDLPAQAYTKSEELFKMAVYTKARKDGMDVDSAARKAEDGLFNYSDIPPLIRHARRWYSPFATWTYKAIPRAAETAVRKPWKIAIPTLAAWGLEQRAIDKFGRTEDEQQAREKALPEYMQGFSQVLLPWKDSYGNDQYLDLAYILPYGELTQTWAQTGIPRTVAPQHPLLDLLATIQTNTDPLTGQSLVNDHADTTAEAMRKYLDEVWKTVMPSLAPGGYNWERMETGVRNMFRPEDRKIEDWMGNPQEIERAALHTLLGIRLRPVNKERLRKSLRIERQKAAREFGKKRAGLKNELKRNKITKEEFRQKIRELTQQKQRVLKDLRLEE